MSARISSTRKPWAFLVALSTVMWLAVPFVGMASAGHVLAHDLECLPETDQNQVGTSHTIDCYVLDTAANEIVRFENNADADGDTPVTPDGTDSTCTAADAPDDTGEGTPVAFDNDATVDDCLYSFTYTGPATARTDLIRAWIDDDSNIATQDFDTTEGRDATATPGTITPEPDDTDVVDKSWFSAALATATLDCDDEAGNDSDNGFAGNDAQTNPQGQSELYTCKVFNDNGTGGGVAGNGIQEGGEAPLAGTLIDAENLGGANDPDTAGQPGVGTSPPNNGTPDYPNACTTAANGQCTFTLTAGENELGVAEVCFWVDDDNDNVYSSIGTQNDGGSCGEAPTTEDDDLVDVVEKTWATSAATFLDVEPEFDSNATTPAAGTQHVMTATVTDQFGNPVANTPVDWQLTGRNGLAGDGGGGPVTLCDNTFTNANGQITCTITDEGTTADPIAAPPAHEDDIVQACISANTAGFACAVPGDLDASTGDDENDDGSDQVEKFWFTSLTAIDEIRVDMENDDCSTFENFDTNSVTDGHDVCVLVEDAADNGLPGRQVTLTINGPGYFEGSNGENLGQSITRGTDANGEVEVTMQSVDTGDAVLTATSGSESGTGTKRWTAGDARNIDCTPETATNESGTEHTISCLVTDALGNPVPQYGTRFIQTGGPGEFQEKSHIIFGVEKCPQGGYPAGQSGTPPPQYDHSFPTCGDDTNSQGVATAIIETQPGELGTTTIVAELSEDFDNSSDDDQPGDTDDECENPAGEADWGGDLADDGATSPGNCEDEVTKTWVEDLPECDDGVDNDGDGETDFPADDGCDSATDDSESSVVIVQNGPCSTFAQGSRTQRPEGGEIIVGTSGDDVLNGTGGNDIICGLAGNDVINGRGGRDQIVGNGGNDTVGGGGGKDTMRGNAGRDSLSGNSGNDVLLGGGGRDTLKGNSGIDTLKGGGGGDTLQGGDGQDILKGGAGDDVLRGGKGADALDGGAGSDQCFGNAGNDRIRRCE